MTTMRRADRPTLDDPAIIKAEDGTFFLCWVERLGNEDRWVFISSDRVRHLGPVYTGETTLAAIRELIDQCRAANAAEP
jgi:hypothetical protein